MLNLCTLLISLNEIVSSPILLGWFLKKKKKKNQLITHDIFIGIHCPQYVNYIYISSL